MEVWEIVGIETNARFKGDDGQLVPGMRLHLIGDADPESGFVGQQVRNQFISNAAAAKHGISVTVGDVITFHFNRFGNISKVEVQKR